MRAEIAIIGGGPAGSALAILLARAGRDVLLIEREAGPHDKVCGEFLSREALLALDALGVSAAALGAVPIETLSLASGGQAVTRALPFPARSLSRRILDEAMIAAAVQAGARLLRGHPVMALAPGGIGWQLRLRDEATLDAHQVVLATGKHDLRGHGRPPGRQPDLIGFKMYFELAPKQRSTIDRRILLGLFPGGYAGLQPVEDGRANLCLVVRQSRFAALGRDWGSLMATLATEVPSLGSRLAGAVPAWPRPLAIAGIPYGFVATDPGPPSLWRLGDQAAVIPSFSGDGMSIALHSARRAATSLLDGETSAMLTARLRRDLGAQVARATAASRLFVHPAAQTLLLAGARHLPSLLTLGAKATRVPERARRIAAKG